MLELTSMGLMLHKTRDCIELVDTKLSKTRDLESTTAFFEQAVEMVGHLPDKVTADGESNYPTVIKEALGK